MQVAYDLLTYDLPDVLLFPQNTLILPNVPLN